TNDGGSWLSINESGGQTSTSSAGVVTVTVNFNGLAPGTYRGSVSFSMAAGVVRTVPVTAIVTAPQQKLDSKTIAACNATKLVPVYTGPLDNFTTMVGRPTPITIRVLDDCGQTASNASVILGLSGGDPQSIPLLSTDKSN